MDMRFGERLFAERRRLRHTRRSFAAAIGIAPQTQASFEENVVLPSIDYLARAALLGVDANFVLLGDRTSPLSFEQPRIGRFRSFFRSVNSVPEGQKPSLALRLKPCAKSLTLDS